MTMQAKAEQAPNPTPPARPTLEQTIEQQVEKAVNQALQGLPANASAAERGRLVREQVQAAIDAARASADAARAGTPVIAQAPPFDASNIIPPQAVDMAVAFFVMVAFIVVGLPIARAIARRMDRRNQAPAATPDVAPRLDRIEQAIEAVAIEVERISEGQRFTTRLMNEMRSLPTGAAADAWPAGTARQAEPVPVPAAERRP
jgi:hypothetical protein